MGIDAELLIRYRGPEPSDVQLARWSWDLVAAVGKSNLFLVEGLPPSEYDEAMPVWRAAFQAHPQYEALRTAPFELVAPIRNRIIADIGPSPERLRRAIGLAGSMYPDGTAPPPGKFWPQDGPTIHAELDETFLRVSLWTRYYGVGYERGDILGLCAIAEWIEANMQPCEVWYGGDSSGVCAEPFPEKKRRELRDHLYGPHGRDYYKHGWGVATDLKPPACALCIPGEPRFERYGWGNNYCAMRCAGCEKKFETRDNGATWVQAKGDL